MVDYAGRGANYICLINNYYMCIMSNIFIFFSKKYIEGMINLHNYAIANQIEVDTLMKLLNAIKKM